LTIKHRTGESLQAGTIVLITVLEVKSRHPRPQIRPRLSWRDLYAHQKRTKSRHWKTDEHGLPFSSTVKDAV